MGEHPPPQIEELPSIVEAVEWLCKDSLAQIPERSERDRLVGLVKIAWNLELLLRHDTDLGLAARSALLGDHENRDVLAESILVTCMLKRERYPEDPRRIEAFRIVDSADREEIEVECSMFSGLPGELVLNRGGGGGRACGYGWCSPGLARRGAAVP